MNFKEWLLKNIKKENHQLENIDFPIPHQKALNMGFIFHGMSEHAFRELISSEGFQGGSFSHTPIQLYGPKFIAINKADMPKPYMNQNNDSNVGYSFDKPHANLIPLRSQEEAEKWGSAYALPNKFIYEADKQGNILGHLKKHLILPNSP